MGKFRIVINAVGGHGVDRQKKDGEVVNFHAYGKLPPDAIASEFVKELINTGCSVQSATIIHWPETEDEVRDDLLTGRRTGNF